MPYLTDVWSLGVIWDIEHQVTPVTHEAAAYYYLALALYVTLYLIYRRLR